ncbi:MAG: hypothetical protein CVT64_10565 [Actinobacteria bacterium HGW-Actinobacteria-4]|nr:MAG: hypothetical protein CVT64_10565 [Actinobacteria bacterium HGW-Actinobacteria-4]
MLGAFIELRLLRLLVSLGTKSEPELAGDPVAELIRSTRFLVLNGSPARPALPAKTRSAISLVVDETEAIHLRRNALVHGVWANPESNALYVWRPARTSARDLEGGTTASRTTSRAEVKELIVQQGAVAQELERCRDLVEEVPRAWP